MLEFIAGLAVGLWAGAAGVVALYVYMKKSGFLGELVPGSPKDDPLKWDISAVKEEIADLEKTGRKTARDLATRLNNVEILAAKHEHDINLFKPLFDRTTPAVVVPASMKDEPDTDGDGHTPVKVEAKE